MGIKKAVLFIHNTACKIILPLKIQQKITSDPLVSETFKKTWRHFNLNTVLLQTKCLHVFSRFYKINQCTNVSEI